MPLKLKLARPIFGALVVGVIPNHFVMAPTKTAAFHRCATSHRKPVRSIFAAAKKPQSNLSATVATKATEAPITASFGLPNLNKLSNAKI